MAVFARYMSFETERPLYSVRGPAIDRVHFIAALVSINRRAVRHVFEADEAEKPPATICQQA
jgi:hypothetical protein